LGRERERERGEVRETLRMSRLQGGGGEGTSAY